jgi:hypothetical protein
MKNVEIDTLFPNLVDKLPVNYRFMVKMEASNFEENYDKYRFSQSVRHFAGEYINAGSYKPLSDIIVQSFFNS